MTWIISWSVRKNLRKTSLTRGCVCGGVERESVGSERERGCTPTCTDDYMYRRRSIGTCTCTRKLTLLSSREETIPEPSTKPSHNIRVCFYRKKCRSQSCRSNFVHIFKIRLRNPTASCSNVQYMYFLILHVINCNKQGLYRHTNCTAKGVSYILISMFEFPFT